MNDIASILHQFKKASFLRRKRRKNQSQHRTRSFPYGH